MLPKARSSDSLRGNYLGSVRCSILSTRKNMLKQRLNGMPKNIADEGIVEGAEYM